MNPTKQILESIVTNFFVLLKMRILRYVIKWGKYRYVFTAVDIKLINLNGCYVVVHVYLVVSEFFQGGHCETNIIEILDWMGQTLWNVVHHVEYLQHLRSIFRVAAFSIRNQPSPCFCCQTSLQLICLWNKWKFTPRKWLKLWCFGKTHHVLKMNCCFWNFHVITVYWDEELGRVQILQHSCTCIDCDWSNVIVVRFRHELWFDILVQFDLALEIWQIRFIFNEFFNFYLAIFFPNDTELWEMLQRCLNTLWGKTWKTYAWQNLVVTKKFIRRLNGKTER